MLLPRYDREDYAEGAADTIKAFGSAIKIQGENTGVGAFTRLRCACKAPYFNFTSTTR